jgi:hypothetical protein
MSIASRILWIALTAFNGITFTAVALFGFVPSPNAVACAAFFAAGVACLLMLRTEWGGA